MSTTNRKSLTATRPVTAVLLDLAYMLHATRVVARRPVTGKCFPSEHTGSRDGEHVLCARSTFSSVG